MEHFHLHPLNTHMCVYLSIYPRILGGASVQLFVLSAQSFGITLSGFL